MKARRSVTRPLDYGFAVRGHSVRVQSDTKGRFDEIAVHIGTGSDDTSLLLHAEMLNARTCFVDVAGLTFIAGLDEDGVVRIASTEDRRSALQKKERR